ncbi:hypothetical protein NDU88_002786 [Pleurodeles waltl]|uniref:Uncharacterized protein n=1 Tax=Pleurodeles waltl TaxID=8319 RepID=A0AAV7T3D7_PLEWA|nr:hypothetical protein NDU88_002786 [Pleurodeles waltl]
MEKMENISKYVDMLKKLVRMCKFGELTNTLIRDQLVRGTRHPKVQKKHLAKITNLRQAISIIESIEHTTSWVKEMRRDELKVAEIGNVDDRAHDDVSKGKKRNPEGKLNSERQKQVAERFKCYRCGSSLHNPDSSNSFAVLSTCKKCGKKGNYASVCKGRKVMEMSGSDAFNRYKNYRRILSKLLLE